ncbi:uncharacterized protein [Clytia hemisphaerica]|uniref:Right handed beta helix domain-containing protein n=1 Tax=Clytia hemisphaerica TaxID=252671 RepID=A0A7M6DP98_9CNID
MGAQIIAASHIGNLTISNSIFNKLWCYSGVFVFAHVSTFTFKGNKISSMNYSSKNGTLLWLRNINNTVMHNNIFENVQSPTLKCTTCNKISMTVTHFTNSYRPIVVMDFQLIYLHSCNFFNNTAGRGGGMSVNGKGQLILHNCNFTDNKATNITQNDESGFQAGAIDSQGVSVKIYDSVFVRNNAETCGTFRITGTSKKTVFLSNVNITTPDRNLPKFATAFEINGPTLTAKNLHVIVQATEGYIDIFNTELSKSVSALKFECPKNAKVNNAQEIFLSCEHCPKDKYTEQAGFMHFNNSKSHIEPFQCRPCPYGGQCTGMKRISSRPNFWGFVQNEIVKFIQCKSGYCCGVGDKCAGIDSCANGRTGPVCGQCHDNHYVNFFDSKCIPNEECTHQILTWVLFGIAAFLLFILVAYFQDLWNLFPCCRVLCRSCKENSDTCDEDEQIIATETPRSSRPSSSGSTSPTGSESFQSALSHPDVSSENEPLIHNEFNPDDIQTAELDEEVSSQPNESTPTSEQKEKEKAGTCTVFFGMIKILFNFYQIKLLIDIEKPSDHMTTKNDWWRHLLSSIFTIQVNFEDFSSSYCFFHGMDDMHKLFIHKVLIYPVVILLAILLMVLYHYIFRHVPLTACCQPNEDSIPFVMRCKKFILRIVLIGYTSIVTFLLVMTSWTFVQNDELVLLVKGDAAYFNNWTITCMVFLVLWAAPFPFNVYFTTRWLQNKEITINKFLICFLFPPFSVIFYLWKRFSRETDDIVEPDAKILLSMYEAPFRRRMSKKEEPILLWDGVVAGRRLIIALVCVYWQNYIFRMVTVLPVLLLCLWHHSHYRPYKSDRMNHLESGSFVLLSTMVGINLVWSFFYVYSLPYQYPMDAFGNTVKVIEVFMGWLPFLFFFCYYFWNVMKLGWKGGKFVFWLIADLCVRAIQSCF